MNPDLAMGDELLKKTGAGNLFMVFGEPDIDITPRRRTASSSSRSRASTSTTRRPAQIRSSSTDDIACWFIDTDYNGESFFVRHAYFSGADEPYEKLKRALRAEIDEAAWATLYSTTSRPFDAAQVGQDRRQGHQPLRRRGAEGVRGLRLAADKTPGLNEQESADTEPGAIEDAGLRPAAPFTRRERTVYDAIGEFSGAHAAAYRTSVELAATVDGDPVAVLSSVTSRAS